VAGPHRTQLRRLGWLALLATGLALYLASLQGIAAVGGELGASAAPQPSQPAVPVSYREDRPAADAGGRGCHRGARSGPPASDF
jgi:hypothetical protein